MNEREGKEEYQQCAWRGRGEKREEKGGSESRVVKMIEANRSWQKEQEGGGKRKEKKQEEGRNAGRRNMERGNEKKKAMRSDSPVGKAPMTRDLRMSQRSGQGAYLYVGIVVGRYLGRYRAGILAAR